MCPYVKINIHVTCNKIRPSGHSKLSSRFRDIDGLYEILST